MALEALDGWLITAAHNFPSMSQRGADDRHDAAIQDMLTLNKLIGSADSIRINHPRVLGVHDAAHANVEGGATQEAHVISAVHNVTEPKVPVAILSWSEKKIKRVVRSNLAAETSSMETCML